MSWTYPDEPLEAQPPPGIRLDDVYAYQGPHSFLSDEKDSVKITYIDDVDEDEDEGWAEVAPAPEPVVVE